MAEVKSNRNTIIGVIAVIIVLAIIGWAAGWFGGAAPEQPMAPATEQPAAPAPAPNHLRRLHPLRRQPRQRSNQSCFIDLATGFKLAREISALTFFCAHDY